MASNNITKARKKKEQRKAKAKQISVCEQQYSAIGNFISEATIRIYTDI